MYVVLNLKAPGTSTSFDPSPSCKTGNFTSTCQGIPPYQTLSTLMSLNRDQLQIRRRIYKELNLYIDAVSPTYYQSFLNHGVDAGCGKATRWPAWRRALPSQESPSYMPSPVRAQVG